MAGAILILTDGTRCHINGTGFSACAVCGVIAEALCDYPTRGGKTCDLPLCSHHACVQGRWEANRDFCPGHHAASSSAPARPRLSRERFQYCRDRAEQVVRAATAELRTKFANASVALHSDEERRIYETAFRRAERLTRNGFAGSDSGPSPGYLF